MSDMRDYGYSCVPTLGEYSFHKAEAVLESHRHAGAMEICFLVYGRQTYEVNGRDFVLGPKDIFITFPDEVHSTGGSPQEVGSLYWLQLFEPKGAKSLPGISTADSKIIWEKLMAIPARCFHGSDIIKNNFAELFNLKKNFDDQLTRIRFENIFARLILNLLATSGSQSVRKTPSVIQKALDYINANLTQPLRVSDVSQHIKLSESWFKGRFKKELGMGPAEYIMRKKIDLATEMLKNGKRSITKIAYILNFSSSQHFSATYKRFTRKSPSEILNRDKTNRGR